MATSARGEIAAAHLREPPLDLTPQRATPRPGATVWGPTLLPTGTLRRRSAASIEALPGFAEGAWWVQDAAAALPARLLGDVAASASSISAPHPAARPRSSPRPAPTSSPSTARPRGWSGCASNLTRLGSDAEIVVADAAAWRPDQPADAVLLDAPCSATGTIRRHPDVPWLKRPHDVAKLAALAGRGCCTPPSRWSSPAALLVFCTCSLQPEEGPAHIDRAPCATDAPVERRADTASGSRGSRLR